nr:hypothetical protein [Tanacetum cinerariifolium]
MARVVEGHRSLNELDNATLHIDGQSTKMSADVARGHGGDGGSDDHPLHIIYPPVAGVVSLTEAKAPETQFGWKESGQAAYPPGDPEPRTQFDLKPHMQSQRWTDINAGIQQHLQNLYNTNKAFSRQRIGVLSGHATGGCPPPPQSTVDPADVKNLKKSNKSLTKQVKMMMRLFRSDNKFSQILDQFESSPEFGGPSGSSGCGDDEPGGNEDGDEDEEDGDS